MFHRVENDWVLHSKLMANDADQFYFGSAVAVHGNTIVVGASGTAISGRAYVFVLHDGVWVQQSTLNPFNFQVRRFGASVSIFEDTIVVGAPGGDTTASIGAAFVFTRANNNWTAQAELASGPDNLVGLFGSSVSMAQDLIMVGAPWENSRQGAVYAFARQGNSWVQEARLFASEGAPEDSFGQSLAIFENTALIGAPRSADAFGIRSGNVYVFLRSNGKWTVAQKVSAIESANSAGFGSSVAISGNAAVIGELPLSSGNDQRQLSAYLFERLNSSWSFSSRLSPNDRNPGSGFGGAAIAIASDFALIGYQYDYTNGIFGNPGTGSVYLFPLPLFSDGFEAAKQSKRSN